MPRPIFDIEQYELRGILPEVYTKEQKKNLDETLARVNGQVDWAAQLLGFNGPNYWGLPNPKADGTYNWEGWPHTMNEKRQLQAGAFGVYNKNLDYETWPSPFNRSKQKASADAFLHIFERDGKTLVTPFGQGEDIDFTASPYLFLDAEYAVDAQVEITVGPDISDNYFFEKEFSGNNVIWTRFKTEKINSYLDIKIAESAAEPFRFYLVSWKDISDWTPQQVQNQFLGLWGNKGNQFSHDFAFDALDVHGFNEKTGLRSSGNIGYVSIEELLASVGLETTEFTGRETSQFQLNVEGCGEYYPATLLEAILMDEAAEDLATDPDELIILSDGRYVITINTDNLAVCEECGYTLTIDQSTDHLGLTNFFFTYEAEDLCHLVNPPCIEWSFDPTLDDGEYGDDSRMPWATVNSGDYDREGQCVYPTADNCGDTFCGFDDGEYNEPNALRDECDDPDYDNDRDNDGAVFAPCPVERAAISLEEYINFTYKMVPDIRNSLTPLRVWKNSILSVVDEVPDADLEFWNFLKADENRGPEPEDAYRHFIRLPLEYPRDERNWNKAVATCDNLSYFSAPPELSETQDDPPLTRPALYDVSYRDTDLPSYTVFYNEDYLVSSWTADNLAVQSGYEDSVLATDADILDGFYTPGDVTYYDPFDYRVANPNTREWFGSYYQLEEADKVKSGFLAQDLEDNIMLELKVEDYPIWDAPTLKYPNVEFPDDNDKASLKNYVVSYAYFVADYSAADDPVFDPTVPYCLREACVINEVPDPGTGCEVRVDGGVAFPVPSYTPCNEDEECCVVDNAIYSVTGNPSAFLGPPTVDGGLWTGKNVNPDDDSCDPCVLITNTAYRLHEYVCTVTT